MTRRRKKNDGERIPMWVWNYGYNKIRLAARIDRVLRKRMTEAWAEGHEYGVIYEDLEANPYRGRRKK